MRQTVQLTHIVERLRSGQRDSAVSINLVPSETRLSPLAQLPLQLDYYNRYFFNEDLDPDFWQFRGGESVADLERDFTRASLTRLSGAEYISVRPVSGMSAMTIAMAGLGGKPGRTVVSIAQASGGHYATASLAKRLGYESSTVDVQHGQVDLESLSLLLSSRDVSLLYLDLQNSLHVLDVGSVVDTVQAISPGTHIHVDCSHTLGLILGGALPNPLMLGATSMGGSTHKSFPGPHKGILCTRQPEVMQRMKEAQLIFLSSHHFAETLSLGLAAYEFEFFGESYAPQVIANARTLGMELRGRGFEVADAGKTITDTHQVWVRDDDIDVHRLSDVLAKGGIRVNIQEGPPLGRGPVLRLGTNEVTLQGAGPSCMGILAEAFTAARTGEVDKVRRLRTDALDTMGEPYYFKNLIPPRS